MKTIKIFCANIIVMICLLFSVNSFAQNSPNPANYGGTKPKVVTTTTTVKKPANYGGKTYHPNNKYKTKSKKHYNPNRYGANKTTPRPANYGGTKPATVTTTTTVKPQPNPANYGGVKPAPAATRTTAPANRTATPAKTQPNPANYGGTKPAPAATPAPNPANYGGMKPAGPK